MSTRNLSFPILSRYCFEILKYSYKIFNQASLKSPVHTSLSLSLSLWKDDEKTAWTLGDFSRVRSVLWTKISFERTPRGAPRRCVQPRCSARRRWTERKSGGIGMEPSLGVGQRGGRAYIGTENKVEKEAGMHRIYEIFPGVVTLYYYPLSHLPAPLCAGERSLGTISTSVPPLSLIVVAARAQHTHVSLCIPLERGRSSLRSLWMARPAPRN